MSNPKSPHPAIDKSLFELDVPSRELSHGAHVAAPSAAKPVSQVRRHAAFALDRASLIIAAVLLVSSASSFALQHEIHLGDEPVMRKLTREEMPALSPLLVVGDVRIEGEDQQLHGWISGTRWRSLAPDARRSAAQDLARSLSDTGIKTADLYDHDKLLLVIRNGQLRSDIGAAR